MYVKTVVSDWQGLERNPSLLVDSDAAETNIIKCKKQVKKVWKWGCCTILYNY